MATKRPLFSQQVTADYLRAMFRRAMQQMPKPSCPVCNAAMDRKGKIFGHVDDCDLAHAMREQKRRPKRSEAVYANKPAMYQ